MQQMINDAKQRLIIDKLEQMNANQIEATDKGFARIYSNIFRSIHRYNPVRKDWMGYDGSRWVDDTEGLKAKQSAKDLTDALRRYAASLNDNGIYLKAVMGLSALRNRNNMLTDAKDINPIYNHELDVNDFLLNVENGILDLSQREPQLIKHNPEMLFSKKANVVYSSDSTCPNWDKFIDEVTCGDKAKAMYLKKLVGLALTGDTKEETCFILYGQTTRNGKSTFVETINYLLGDYAVSMRPESLAIKTNPDSRTANGDIARLAGCRFVSASEPPKRMLLDVSNLKSLIGRDSITARHLQQREFTFIPKFKLIINTNHLPFIDDDTVFLSNRLNVITFDRHFSEFEQDKDLKDRLKKEHELSGILNWALEGLRLYRQEGLNPPESVKKSTNEYRAKSDKLGCFISECLKRDSNSNIKAKEVYDKYSDWCNSNQFGCEAKGVFFGQLRYKGMLKATGTIDGKTIPNVLSGYKFI